MRLGQTPMEFDFELPAGFDFDQHVYLSFDVNLQKVVAVEKKGMANSSNYDALKSQKEKSQKRLLLVIICVNFVINFLLLLLFE